VALRRICVVTGSRAEYGLLHGLMRAIAEDPALELQVVVTGMHLAPEFGSTYRAIEADGFLIDRKVETLLSSDRPAGITTSMGLGMIGFASAFDALAPDIVLVLGDRYEMLPVAAAALVARIPLAHIHGGEITEGAIDESIRHAITKLAQLHFVAADAYRRRVIQLGEAPERVFNVGALGLDNIERLALLDRAGLETALGMTLGARNFLVTYHPVTLADVPPDAALAALFGALDAFPDAHVILTKANADADGRAINALIDGYANARAGRVVAFASLGQLRYLSAMRLADAVIGNSSSGIIEAPYLRVPTVNIGDRQRGRLRAASIVDVPDDAAAICAAIETVSAPGFRASLPPDLSLFGTGNAAPQIVRVLRETDLHRITTKPFYDLPVSAGP